MKLLIDIPEQDYDLACNHPEALIDVYARYIKKGIPIHGRIVDIDDVINCIKEAEGEDALYALSLIDWAADKRIIGENKCN